MLDDDLLLRLVEGDDLAFQLVTLPAILVGRLRRATMHERARDYDEDDAEINFASVSSPVHGDTATQNNMQ